MSYVDNFLNKITMYKLVLYSLQALAGLSIIFGFLGIISYSGVSLILSAFTITVVCYLTNLFFAKIYDVQTNVESSSITAFILFFVLSPLSSFADLRIYILVGILAMASKYILSIKKKHIFNPAGVAVFIVGLFGSGVGFWWVGGVSLFLPVLIVGILVLRKLKRFELFLAFAISSLASMSYFGYINGFIFYETLVSNFISGPVLFFGTIMLTEPLTTPPYRKSRILYGVIAGVLFGSQFSIGPIFSTPEFSLIIANIFSYIVSPRARLVLTLKQKNKLTNDVYEFIWNTPDKLKFKAGQYLEWTLGHKNPDSRGNRRYFTLSSSPTEENLGVGIKFYENSSSFKNKMVSLNVGDKLVASQLAGEFTLPEDKSKKLVFIAGGIGVTPFRSMAKYLSDMNEKRDIILLFSCKSSKDLVYKNVFDEAYIKSGIKTIYVVGDSMGETLTSNMKVGPVNSEMIISEISDYKDRIFYISGPHGMVSAFESTLNKLGVPSSNIKIDFFPGYV